MFVSSRLAKVDRRGSGLDAWELYVIPLSVRSSSTPAIAGLCKPLLDFFLRGHHKRLFASRNELRFFNGGIQQTIGFCLCVCSLPVSHAASGMTSI